MLIELLRNAVATVPDQPVVLSSEGSCSYIECLHRSEALARGLSKRGVTRFACVIDAVDELLALMCASSATGSEACVYPTTADMAWLESYVEMFEHGIVVTDR